jgi:methylglyoxal synthase
MDGQKRIALSAHDALKPQLAAWAFTNDSTLARHRLTATGNTGRYLMTQTGLQVDCVRSGPLGGDMELGTLIAEGRIDILMFFVDPLTRRPHDVDPAPLWRIAAIGQTAVAMNEATADFLVRSELMAEPYPRTRAQPALRGSTQRLDRRKDVS